MKFQRFTAGSMSLLMALTLIAGCGQTSSGNTDTSADPAGDTTAPDAETTPAETGRAAYSDGIPELDFENADFRISATDRYAYEIDVEQATGDICDDAIYKRNTAIEERFNINIVPVITEMDAANDKARQPDAIRTSIMSGADEYDLTAVMVYKAGGLILEECFMNWRDLPYINYDQPWWPEEVNNTFTIDGKQYAAVSDFCITTLQLSYAFLFNKQIAEESKLEDLYQVVKDGRWTIDYLTKITADVYKDLNGNTSADDADRYGFIGDTVTGIDVWLPAFGIQTVAKNGDELTLALNNDKTVAALDKVLKLYYGSTDSFTVYYDEKLDMFKQNQALFIPVRIIALFNELRDMDVDFGVLPYPKFDEDQEKYLGNSLDNYSVLSVPVTAPDPDMSAAIVEALSCESYKSVVPAYYEIALESKYTRDESSIEMLDLIMAGRNYDISILHSDITANLPYLFRVLVQDNNPNFASEFAANRIAYEGGIKTLIEGYQSMD